MTNFLNYFKIKIFYDNINTFLKTEAIKIRYYIIFDDFKLFQKHINLIMLT